MPLRDELRELWKYRELLLVLVQRDLRVRYKNSVLGFAWSLVNPLIQVLTIAVVLRITSIGPVIKNHHAYLFCATLPWVFFSSAVMDTSLALLTYQDLIRRVYFPRALIPISGVLSNLIHFVLATGALLVYLALNSLGWWLFNGQFDWPIAATALLIPIPMLGLTLLITGLSMLISVWAVYFDDIRYLAESALRIFYWLVPVLYFADALLTTTRITHNRLVYTLYMLNPLASFISTFRKFMLVPTQAVGDAKPYPGMTPAEWGFLAIALCTSLIIAMAGYRYFSQRQWRLAERP